MHKRNRRQNNPSHNKELLLGGPNASSSTSTISTSTSTSTSIRPRSSPRNKLWKLIKKCFPCFIITCCLVLLYSYQASLQHNDAAPNSHDEGAENKDAQKQRPCRVILENAIDYHHEVIESVVRRFPLPWHTFNCTTSKPIIYDFALFQNRFPDRILFTIGEKPKYLNQTEFWGWKQYFEHSLQHTTVNRLENVEAGENLKSTKAQTFAYYNDFVTENEYDQSPNGPADAIIDISCGIDKMFISRLENDKRAFCLLHGYVPELDSMEYVRNKTCWISPMFPDDYCSFLPIDLPVVTDNDPKDPKRGLRVCAPGGGGRKQQSIVDMFSRIPYQEHDVKLSILTRRIQPPAAKLSKKLGIDNRITFLYEKDFVKFSKLVSQCDIYLPMTDPATRPAHFRTGVPGGGKSLTGAIPQILAYGLASVMHVELEKIYHDYLTSPVEVYAEETVESRAAALTRMVVALSKENAVEPSLNLMKSVLKE